MTPQHNSDHVSVSPFSPAIRRRLALSVIGTRQAPLMQADPGKPSFCVLKWHKVANFPMTSKSSPTSQSGMNRLSMLDCSCFLFVNYILIIQNQSNLETRCMFLDRRETGRGSAQPPCGLPLRAPCVLISPESG